MQGGRKNRVQGDWSPGQKVDWWTLEARYLLYYSVFTSFLNLITIWQVSYDICFIYAGANGCTDTDVYDPVTSACRPRLQSDDTFFQSILSFMRKFGDAQFLLHMMLTCISRFNTVHEGQVAPSTVCDGTVIFFTYMGSWFIVDLMTLIPNVPELMGANMDDRSMRWLAVFRLARLHVVWQFRSLVPLKGPIASFLARIDSVYAILRQMIIFIFISHGLACLFFLTGREARYQFNKGHSDEAGWVVHYDLDRSKTHAYVSSLYYGLTVLTSTGFGDFTPRTELEMGAMCFGLFVSAFMYASIFGVMTVTLQRMNMQANAFTQQQDMIRHFNKSNENLIPHELQQELVRYSDFHWKIHQGFDRDAFLRRFPSKMASQVRAALLSETIRSVHYFEGCNQEFVRKIAKYVKMDFFLDGYTLYSMGERGYELYFLHKGLVQLMQSDGTVLVTMLPSSHFGEIAVFGDGIRSATAKTKTACEIYYLKKADIVETLGGFPSLKLKCYQKALAHLKSDLDDLHEAELGLSMGPPMTDEQIRRTKKRVEKSIMELEIEIQSIEDEIAGRITSSGGTGRRSSSTSFLGNNQQHRISSIELLKKIQNDIKPRGNTFTLRESVDEGSDKEDSENVLSFKEHKGANVEENEDGNTDDKAEANTG